MVPWDGWRAGLGSVSWCREAVAGNGPVSPSVCTGALTLVIPAVGCFCWRVSQPWPTSLVPEDDEWCHPSTHSSLLSAG